MRPATFAMVGVIGFGVQLSALAALLAAGCPYLPATAAAVELAVLHNFWWHERWTWADRTAGKSGFAGRLLRFNATTGATSIVGNVAFMAMYVGGFGFDPMAANVLAVVSTAAANFLVADRWVFAAPAVAVVVLSCAAPVEAAALKGETIDAWNRYVSTAEAGLWRRAPSGSVVQPREAEGEAIAVPSGLIHRWRGTLFIRGVTLDPLLRALMHPGTPPPQEDVLESRVLGRSNDSLRVYLKLVRRTIVTATYNTEHDVTFRRHSPTLATSRSVATRIAEVDYAGTRHERERPPGDDRGFLWRLNSYWRYTQVEGGVQVELDSLTLSRDLPALVRPLAAPIVDSVARESIDRTLEALGRWPAAERRSLK